MKSVELAPIKESVVEWDKLEARILQLFRKNIYLPILEEMGVKQSLIQNASDDLLKAIQSGRVRFMSGQFKGKFSARISKEIRAMGGEWSRKDSGYRLPAVKLTPEVRHAIDASDSRFERVLQKIDKKLQQMIPEEIAGKLHAQDLFDKSLWKTQRSIEDGAKNITVIPKLSDDERAKIAESYTENLKLYVSDFSKKEIEDLRQKMLTNVFQGARYEGMISTLQKSYGISHRKAKFLARQETGILMAKFKRSRYESAGVRKYVWKCVSGTKLHPVRPWHKTLDGKTFSFDDPPITTEPGTAQRRNNPGEDYNCRCFARPIVQF